MILAEHICYSFFNTTHVCRITSAAGRILQWARDSIPCGVYLFYMIPRAVYMMDLD